MTPIAAETIVAQALDDLEAERLELPAALRLVATLAWRQGHREAEHPPPGPGQTSAPCTGSSVG